jgi:hypothetical protein
MYNTGKKKEGTDLMTQIDRQTETAGTKSILVGTFPDNQAAIGAIKALSQAGFSDEQLGFAARSHDEHVADVQHKMKHGPDAIAKGIIGGLLGIADLLLLPVTGPSDAATILGSTLPVAEETLDRLPYPGKQVHQEQVKQSQVASVADQETAIRPASSVAETSEGEPASLSANTSHAEQAGQEPQESLEVDENVSTETGAVVGGFLGSVAALLIPGIGPFVAGGIIVAALSGGAIGSIAGNFLGAFSRLGIPEDEARGYEQDIKENRTLVTVRTNERQDEAEAILKENGAQSVGIH